MIKLSTEWLSVCGGCHVSILDLDLGEDEKELKTSLTRILGQVKIVRCPVLMDEKNYPKADVGIITGAIRSEHDRKAARLMRDSCKILIGFGTCAVFGGISGAGYVHTTDEVMNAVYLNNSTTTTNSIPDDQIVPAWERIPMPVDEVVKLDLYLPGCPPHRCYINNSLLALVENRTPEVENKSVCSKCNRVMEKNNNVTQLRRESGTSNIDEKKCFLSQGYLCLGSVTIDRCLLPCPNQRMPCIGCAGPTPQIITEPNRDIRTELSKRISLLTNIKYEVALEQIELFSKTHYAYIMASPLINQKNTFNIKKWIHKAEDKRL
jgi:F420-non-reducing hydrogenase small subunit